MIKKLHVATIILLTFCFNNTISAQTLKERQDIRSFYNIDKLRQLEQSFSISYEKNKSKAYKYARERELETTYFTVDGRFVELQGILPDGTLLYYTTFNDDAARSTRTDHLNIGGSLGLNLDGQNMTAHVWDGGLARPTHQEYDGPGGSNRFSIGDGSSTLNFHAAHVTGTIIASGVQPAAKGMAPQAKAIGYDWNSDLSEVTSAAANGMLLSNHSYGYGSDGLPSYFFGAYIPESRDWDNLLYNAPYYLMVVAAGNDGNTNYNANPLSGNPAYDKLTGHAISKNNMVVANAQDANIDAAGNLISVVINSSSSEGPTDDFRIKPDITGNGTGLYSTYHNSDTDYNSITGTSMASPNVTGSLLLLQQHANTLNGSFMRAATLKGLALHTADDIGPIGPDAIHGWGLLNAKKAAETLSNNSNATIVQEIILNQGETYSIDVTSNGFEDLKASISWTDPAGIATTNLNDTTPVLINDLDISVTQNTNTYYPWRLTGVNSNANDTDNAVDNFERVDIQAASGTYTITVTHKGTLTNSSQNFSFIVTGIDVECISTTIPSNIQALEVTSTTAMISWDAQIGALYDLRYRETGTATWTDVEDLVSPNTTLIGLADLTEYEVQVRSKCPAETPSAYSSSVFFTTLEFLLNYCDAGGNGANNSASYEKISNITFSGSNPGSSSINNSSTSTSGYEDFTSEYAFVKRGVLYLGMFTATISNPYPSDQILVWIDFNQDGDFLDPGENVFTSATGNGPHTGDINIPISASLGSTRMRVRLHDVSFGPNSTPCGNSNYGQVEDYTVIIYDDYVHYDNTWTPQNPAGVSTNTDNILVVDGSPNLSVPTSTNTLNIQRHATLNIESVLSINGDLNNDGDLVFKSRSNIGPGQLNEFTGAISGSGQVTVERYVPAGSGNAAGEPRRAYRFLTSAVNSSRPIFNNWQQSGLYPSETDFQNNLGTHITGSAGSVGDTDPTTGFDYTSTGNPSMFTFNNTVSNQDAAWEALPNTNSRNLRAGEAYLTLIRGDRTLDISTNSPTPTNTRLSATGSLITGDHILTSGNNATVPHYGMSTTPSYYNLIGNPYQAIVDLTEVLNATNSSNINTTQYWYWDPNLDNSPDGTTHGGYTNVNIAMGMSSNGSNANQFLMPGQAIFVRNNSAISGPVNVTFTESAKNVAQIETAIFSEPQSSIKILLYRTTTLNNGGRETDGLALIFNDNGNNSIDEYDGTKMFNHAENLARVHSGNLLSIESRALPQDTETLGFFLNNYTTNQYSFIVQANGIMDSFEAYIQDNYTGLFTELNEGQTQLDFSVDQNIPESIATDRFSLVFNTTTLATADNSFGQNFSLFPNPSENGAFSILTPGLNGEVYVEIIDLLGRQISLQQLNIENQQVNVKAQSLSTGVYVVKLKQNEQSFSSKLIVE